MEMEPSIRTAKYLYKTGGTQKAIKWIVKLLFGKLSGINECKEQIDTLYYFLNQCVDIRKVPEATGALRELQMADTALLRLFHEICVKNHLTYWADGGTLLGAVRHGGFIPWDDDTDVVMPREDFNRAKSVLKEEFAPYGVVAEVDEDAPMRRIGIGYKHEETGVWIDVLPVDECVSKEPLEVIESALCEKMHEYRRFYFKNKSKISESELAGCKERIISFEQADGENIHRIMFHGPEFITRKWYMYDESTIYPLRLLKFEDIHLFVPNDYHKYCTMMFGNYMLFPRNGIESHGEGTALSARALRNGVDMREVQKKLYDAYKDYISIR